MSSMTTIRVSTETKDMIKAHGAFGQSYDEVLRQLLSGKATGARKN